MRKKQSTSQTRVNRRTFLATGSAALATPTFVTRAFASSGELNFMGWAGFDYSSILSAFKEKTGITVNMIEMPDQDAMLSQVRAAGDGNKVDIVEPSADRVQDWHSRELIQPIDEAAAGMQNVLPDILNGAAKTQMEFDGERYASPTAWGTEAIAFDHEKHPFTYGELSLADIWDESFKSKLALRPWSGLVAKGRELEAKGVLPHPYNESYEDEAKCDANFEVILAEAIKGKANVAQFWSDQASGEAAFRNNGCEIGHVWDSIGFALASSGMPISYLAPKEGAAAWLQSLVITHNAPNREAAHAWINWMNSPEGSAAWANMYGVNASAKGAAEFLDPAVKEFAAAAYPEDALSNLWWEIAQPAWFVSKRTEYADKFSAA